MLSYTNKLRLAVYHLCVIVILFFGTGNIHGAGRRTDRSVLTVMTLKAEFLWDGVSPEEGRVNFPWKNSETEASEHMEEVAEIIKQCNPDIVLLVEVENEHALGRLNNNYLQGRGYNAYFVKGRDTYTGQDVALLTRIDPESNQIYRDDNRGQSGNVTKGVSKNLYAKFTIGNTKIVVIGLHFLAQPNRESRRRDREAQQTLSVRGRELCATRGTW